METRSPIRTGLLDILPLAVPAIPFGLVMGIAIVDSPIDNFVGWLSSWIIFAGAAQLVLVTLLGSATAASAIVAALIVNSRHFMYSVALAETFKKQPRWFRWLAPYTLIDQIFAMATTRLEAEPGWFRTYYISASVLIWTAWQLAVAAGVLLGGSVPADWQLEFAIPVLFASLVVLGLDRRPAVVAAVVGFLAAGAAGPLPNRASILVGALAGVIAGTVADHRQERVEA